PIENRGYDRERKNFSRCAKGVREFQHLFVELRQWEANPKSLATHGRRARAHVRIRRNESRSGATRIQICWVNDLLRLDASDRHGQRSSRYVPATCATPRVRSPHIKNRTEDNKKNEAHQRLRITGH